jgi:hypothetical protein
MEVRMSLMKKPKMSMKRVAANQRNGLHSLGPVTLEGRKRVGAAHTRHGFYSQAEEVALACLGEDPAELGELRNSLHGDLQPPGGLEKELVEHLVEVVWRWKRSGRMQEGFALRQAKDVNLTREDRLHAHMMRLKMTEESLRLLAQSVAREYYVTTPADLDKMKALHREGVVKEMGEIALALFYRLEPDKDKAGPDDYERARLMVAQAKEIFGIGMTARSPQADAAPDVSEAEQSPPEAVAAQAQEQGPPSCFTPAEWEAREPARQLLENILTRQVEICAAQRMAILKESVAGPSPYERAAEIALAHPNAALMQRMEESSFRQIWRITNLLLKLRHPSRGQGRRARPPVTP